MALTNLLHREHFSGIVLSGDEIDCGEAAFGAQPELQEHLGRAIVRSLASAPEREVVVDHAGERQVLPAGRLLAVAIALSRRWRASIAAPRVGIVLPPGTGAFFANVAVFLAGKVPVNLNFTTGRAAAEVCLRKAGIDVVITAAAMRERLPDFPWPERTLLLPEEIVGCGLAEIGRWRTAINRPEAREEIARQLELPVTGGDAEATILFTSGSSGDPKGVVLTHRNLIGNCRQFLATRLFRPGETMIGCLPVFHSFGFTITMCFPLLHDVRVATYPSPLETKRIAEIIAAEHATALIGAPTFLRPFLKRAVPEQMRSLRFVVAGAEKMPRDLADGFRVRFGVPVLEGYGLTETSPLLAVNRLDPMPLAAGGTGSAHRAGSVGLVVDGVRARIVDPATREPQALGTTGMLAVRGPNVFRGYLDDATATNAVLRDGWFFTGDLARFDAEGILHIEGRLSRFSKIGGEMVPHIKVEQSIIAAMGWQGAETQPVVVMGVTDPAKGEALVALTTRELDGAALRQKLTAAGLPNLWIPKRFARVEKIPVLATGKLDLRGCKRVAETATSTESS